MYKRNEPLPIGVKTPFKAPMTCGLMLSFLMHENIKPDAQLEFVHGGTYENGNFKSFTIYPDGMLVLFHDN